MRKLKLSDMHRGWLIGNFEPSVLKTDLFEVGVLTHVKGEEWPNHYHALATEYNVLIEGSMTVNNRLIEVGDIFIFDKMEACKPTFHEDCKILCIKIPSIPGDKHEVL